ncbi:UNVERIFIED_CONTAM: hypothetical protein PYX00_001703 [Menopon gallinae]|uniref:t-SNARE coiled-coil homology domain-containing protein n=1 Tax=Menopon gallinae TaxID=328185 RepID=A0AAW2IF31_9NEOP
MDSNYSSNFNGSRENDFNKLSQSITTNIQKITQNVSSFKRMINQLGTPQETSQMKNKLQEIQNYTQQLVKDTSISFQELSKLPPPTLQSEQKQQKLLKARLTEEFSLALNNFQAAQRLILEREKVTLQKKRTDSNLDISLPNPNAGGFNKYSDHLIELQDHSTQSQQIQSQQMLQDEMNVKALEDRMKSINELETNIKDINEIFKKLGCMVHEQGEILESIEANVDRTCVQITEGAQQLRIASEHQTKLRKKKFCLLMILLAVLLVIIIIIIVETN